MRVRFDLRLFLFWFDRLCLDLDLTRFIGIYRNVRWFNVFTRGFRIRSKIGVNLLDPIVAMFLIGRLDQIKLINLDVLFLFILDHP